MEDKHHIDALFRDRLGDYAEPAPMHIWEKMNQEKGGKSLAWLKGLIPIIIIGLFVGLYLFYPENNSETASTPATDIESLEHETSQRGSIESAQTSSLSISNTEENSDSGNKNQDNINGKSQSTQSTALASIVFNERNHQKAEKQEERLSNNSSLNSMSGGLPALPNSVNFDEQDEKSATAITNADVNDEDINPAISNSLLKEDKIANESLAKHQNNALPFLKHMLYSRTFDEIELSPCHFAPTDDCFDDQFEAKNYADFIFSADFAFKDLSSRFEQTDGYLNQRLETEYAYYAYSSGVRLSRVSEKGFAIRTGLIYSQINEVFDHTSTEYIPKAINVTIDTMYNPNGDTIFVWDTISVIEVVEERTVATNKYRMLDIPLTAGFEYPVGKFIFNVNGGIMLNLFMKNQGSILDLSGEVASIDSNNPNAIPAYKNKIGISLVGSIGVNYRLNHNVIILFEPYIRHIVQPVSHVDYPLEQKYTIAGLRTGLRYKF